MNFSYIFAFLRGVIIGAKCVFLLYIMMILTWIYPNIIFFPFIVIFGLVNGFLDAVIVSMKNEAKLKVVTSFIGCVVTVGMLFLSIRFNVPDMLSQRFVNGAGGGLEASGWFAFVIWLIIFLGISLCIGFSLTLILLSNKNDKND